MVRVYRSHDSKYTHCDGCDIPSSTTMASLVSPKPVSYMQHTSNPYGYGRGHSNYSETPPLASVPLASAPGLVHPVPHQPVGQFMTSAPVQEDGKIYGLVIELMDPNTREGALLELSKKREQYDDLALVLWHSFGA